MEAASFAEANGYIHIVGSDYTLSFLEMKLKNGDRAFVSCWKPTKEDLEVILKTGRIWLTVIGDDMPVALLSTDKPFGEVEDG